MSVLSDKWIRKMSKEEDMISPFEEKQVRGNSISYGLSSFGILNFSTVLANTKELGGIMHSEIFLVTKFVGLKFLGSTISEFTFVNILNSSDTLAS